MTEEHLAPDFDNLEPVVFKPTSDNAGVRLDVFLSEKLTRYSRTFIAKLIKDGNINVEKGKNKAGYRIRGNETITLQLPKLMPSMLKPYDYPLEILYEDELLLVVNKPAGLTTHPVNNRHQDTLANAVVAHTDKLSSIDKNPLKLGIVHRLDRETSGAIIVAKDEWAHYKLSEQFQARTTQKEYHAIVIGNFPYDEDIVDLPIGRHLKNPVMMAISERGKSAKTFFKTLERNDSFSYVAAFPKTGRTHQIRVHLSYRGFPIAGDKLYSTHITKNKSVPIERHALHAYKIKFTHPKTLETLEITAPYPQDFQQMLDFMREQN
ncbi:MAG: RluA family pseudouridine synthase [Planctomycetes bacterium]|nr:RluA family pseudouridine synthase [Planctomycetota bacterium]